MPFKASARRRRVRRVQEFVQQTTAASPVFFRNASRCFFQGANFLLQAVHFRKQGPISFPIIALADPPGERYARFLQELLKKLIHGFEAVRIARIISQQDVVLKKKRSSLPPSRKTSRFFNNLVVQVEIVAKQGSSWFWRLRCLQCR